MTLKEYSPEAVIIATGSEPQTPDIKGLQKTNYILYSELLSEKKIPEDEEVIVLGGGMIGIEVANYLSQSHDKKVTIIEENATLGSDLYSLVGSEIVQRTLDDEKITVHVDTEIEAIKEGMIIGKKKNKEFTLSFTSLILANQAKPDSPNEIEIREIVPRTFKIGDCKKRNVRKLLEAVEEGYQIALNIEDAEPQPIVTFEEEEDTDLKSVVIRKISNGTFSIEDIPEYLEVMVQICNNDKKIQKKSRKSNLKFQFNIAYGPSFWIKIDKGKFSSGKGRLEEYDVVIEMNKNIAAGMFTGEVNAAAAYMSKQLKFDGPLRHGMKFQKWTNAVQKELGIDT
jgi:putative sterol carrier protein